jgi:hypothetical protein|tara:strand:- start:146 stop:514 length:369 start_codon:yes stop_codon:yes gene_type:complete
MKTFNDYLVENDISEKDYELIKEGLQEEWTPELEAQIDDALDMFEKEYMKEDGTYDLERLNEELTNEGFFGSIIGGLAGFALGKSVGKMIARVLGIQKGIFYDLLTSRLVGTALGATMGKRM